MARIHYHRHQQDYAGWSLWVWLPGQEAGARELPAVTRDAFGVVFDVGELAAVHPRIGILPKLGAWTAKDGPDRYWDISLGADVYLLEGDDELYMTEPGLDPRIKIAYLDSPTRCCVNLNMPVPVTSVTARTLVCRQRDQQIACAAVQPYNVLAGRARTFIVTTAAPLDPELLRTDELSLTYDGVRSGPLVMRYVLDAPQYDCDLPFGPYVDADHLFLRVWAPAARTVRLVLSAAAPLPDAAADASQQHDMHYAGNGVWDIKLFGDFRGWYYRLATTLLHAPARVITVLDPYARAIDRAAFAGILVDDATPVTPAPVFPLNDAVIYEIHVRDLTNDPSAAATQPGTFAALAQPGTTLPGNPSVTTGFDHLRELGVNAAQLMPIHAIDLDDRASPHAWGYMTLHFNAPEPSYASDGHGATAVRECKHMVDALHRAGIKVVMDVVYNHSTESAAHAVHWNGLAPDYFYRARPDGSYWNGSGCGNEFRSEGRMARRFLLDSLSYWVRAYGIDGFRFDLMGLIDRETMRMIVAALRVIKPDIFIYGEPWAGGETPIQITAKGTQKGAGFSCFNDHFRNAIAGNVFNNEPGYLLDGRNREDVRRGLAGGLEWFTDAPYESINYVECHDNRTLRDRLAASMLACAPALTNDDARAMARLAAFLVLTAQGVPFVHLGQDFFRSKMGEHNSYNLGDAINNIRWEDKAHAGDLFQYYRAMIALRRAHPLLRLPSKEEVEKRLFFGVVRPPFLVAEISDKHTGDIWRRALLLINPSADVFSYVLPEAAQGWHVYVAAHLAAVAPLYVLTGARCLAHVHPRSAMLVAEPYAAA
jgi:pullulanase